MSIEEISQKLREGSYSPAELADFQVRLAGEYSFIASRLEEILKAKPQEWLRLRAESKSDAQADKKWEASQMGIEETIYNLKTKAISKMLTSINSRLHVANMEARNNY